MGRVSELGSLGGIDRASSFNHQKDNMKIRTRDVGLLAFGFAIGAVVTASLTSTPARGPAAPASTFVATGPVLAVASLPPQFIGTTNFQLQLPPMRFEMRDSFDAQSPLYPPMRRSVDLIDTRYQPDIKPEDLR